MSAFFAETICSVNSFYGYNYFANKNIQKISVSPFFAFAGNPHLPSLTAGNTPICCVFNKLLPAQICLPVGKYAALHG